MAAVHPFLAYLHELGIADPRKQPRKQNPYDCYAVKYNVVNAKGYRKLTNKLLVQRKEHKIEIKRKVHEALMLLYNEFKEKYRGINPNKVYFKKPIDKYIKTCKELENDKSDIQWSSSTWNIDRFREYIGALEFEFTLPYTIPENICQLSDPLYSSIQNRYRLLATVYLGAQVENLPLRLEQKVTFLKKLQICEYREATTRIFVDALTFEILQPKQMQVRLEEKLFTDRDQTLPNSIADYVIYSKRGKILGAIETKDGGYLKAESVTQCMLQLLALRRKAEHPLFGVVTDAIRYVFIVLRKDGTFVFERDPRTLKPVTYDINTWRDLRKVVRVFNFLLQWRQR